MEAVLEDTFFTDSKMPDSFSNLDKGIDDMESGRLCSLEEAFRLVRIRLEGES